MTREILLIDDDGDELELFNQALHSVDKAIQCSHAKDLEEALAFLKHSAPAFIFIDFNMPRANGLECLAEIKKMKGLDKSRVILYSNHIDDELVQKATRLGAYKCVKKPNMINLLVRRLKEIITADQIF